MQRCLSPESTGNASWGATRDDGVEVLRATLRSPFPTPLLRAWTTLKLTSGAWKDALAAAVDVGPLSN